MKIRSEMEEKFYQAAQQIVEECGFDLYDLEFITGSSTLRVFIMDPETNTAVIDDCVKVDRALTPIFEESWVPDDIVLEVSSPGVFRTLKNKNHFDSAVGEYILLGLESPLDPSEIANLPKHLNKLKKIRVKLLEVNDNNIKIDADGFEFNVGFSAIKKATLDPAI